jgi:ATP synthase protein I
MEEQPQKKDNRKDPAKKTENSPVNAYAKYTGLGIQMIAVILVSVWGGIKLDELLSFKTPVFTIILSLLGVFAAIYTAVKDFIK